jgi:hypothetical protein
MTKITISNQSRKSKRKYKSENGRTLTSEYIRGGIRCHGGVSIPCRPVTPTVSPISTFDRRYHPQSRSVCQERPYTSEPYDRILLTYVLKRDYSVVTLKLWFFNFADNANNTFLPWSAACYWVSMNLPLYDKHIPKWLKLCSISSSCPTYIHLLSMLEFLLLQKIIPFIFLTFSFRFHSIEYID